MNYRVSIAFLVINMNFLYPMEYKPLPANTPQEESKIASLFTLCVDKITFEQIVQLIKNKNSFKDDTTMQVLHLKELLLKTLQPEVLTNFVDNSAYVASLHLPVEVDQEIARILINNNPLRNVIKDCCEIPSRTFKVQGGNCLVSLSPDGNYIAIGTVKGDVYVWDAYNNTCVYSLPGHTKTVNAVSWSWDSECLASSSNDSSVCIWQMSTGTCIKTLKHDNKVGAVCWNSDGTFLASGDDSGVVYLWNRATEEKRIFHGHTGSIRAVSWSDDDAYVASGSADLTVRIWDTKTGEHKLLESMYDLATMSPFVHAAASIAWSRNGSYIITSSDNCTVYVWDIALGHCIYTMYGHIDWVRSACLSLDGHYIAGGSDEGVVRIWDVDTNTHLYTLKGYPGWVNAVNWGFHCNYIVASSNEGTVYVWDVRDIKILNSLNLKQALLLEVLQDNNIEFIKSYPHLCTIFNTLPVFAKQALDPNQVIPSEFLLVIQGEKHSGLGKMLPTQLLPTITGTPFYNGLPEQYIDEITAQEADTLLANQGKKTSILLLNRVTAALSCYRLYWPLSAQFFGKTWQYLVNRFN